LAASPSRTIGAVQDPDERKRPRRIWRVSWATRILAPLALVVVLGAVYVVVRRTDDEGSKNDPVKTKVANQGNEGKGGKGEDGGGGKPAEQTYVIKSGDSLSAIAEKFNVTVDDILRWNVDADLDPNALVAGDEIKIH
jgi:hypothetical protein